MKKREAMLNFVIKLNFKEDNIKHFNIFQNTTQNSVIHNFKKKYEQVP